VKAFFRWLAGNGVIPGDPAESVPQQTVLSPLPDVLTPYEMAAVTKAGQALRKRPDPDARPAALVGLLLHTGIKKGECLALQVPHIDLDAPDGPTMFVRYGEVKKRYKERKLPLDPNWVTVYQEYNKQYSPRQRVFPWSPRRLEYLLEDLGQLAGLGKHLSFDMCRWTCALHDYRAGMDPDRIRMKLGISKIQWREVGAKLESIAGRER
jgi:integrase/recombinase XerD